MKLIHISIAVVFSFCTIVWLRHTENVDVFFDYSLPAGQRFYLASKLLGLLALAGVILQISLMLLTRYAPNRFSARWTAQSHLRLGLCTFLLVFTHSATFIIAASLRGGSPAYGLLQLNFNSGLYNAAVSFGLIAFYLSSIMIILGVLSRGNKVRFKRYHRLIVWPMLLCVLIHSIAIGSESKTWPMIVFYCVSVITLIWLLYRKRRHMIGNR